MNTEKIVREARLMVRVGIAVGFLLLGFGILFDVLDVSFISNTKALIGLSFMPFSFAGLYYWKLSGIKKNPEKMKDILISENDERLTALKNEADTKAFRILQGAIFLSYMGYTLMVPEDIFESVGWWILMGLLFIAFLSKGILTAKAMKNSKSKELSDG